MKIQRYKTNPFLELGQYEILNKSKTKIQAIPLGVETWVNQHTGEVTGTQIIKYKRVDREQFVKIFTRNIGFIFDLTSAGNRSFAVLIWVTQKNIGNDLVQLDSYVLEDFLKESKNKPFTDRTFFRGLSELEKANIIAKSTRKSWYFINPNFIFNGDRIAFTTILDSTTKSTNEKLEELGQQRLID